jgi:hypothetical protein
MLYAPLWLPVLLLGASLGRGLLSPVVPATDHCLRDLSHGHHHHLCLVHPPAASGHGLVAGLAALIGVVVVLGFARWWGGVYRQQRAARGLVQMSRAGDWGPDVRLLDCEAPVACAVGLVRPVILVSRGLTRALKPDALRVVLEHERAHIVRGDTRWATLDALMASVFPAAVRERLLLRIGLARECACDARAARQTGSPLLVAQTLTLLVRLGLAPEPAGVSMAAVGCEVRVRRLLDPPAAGNRSALRWGVGLVALLLGGMGPLHNALEWLATAALH